MSLILMQDLQLPSVLGTEMVNLGRLIQGDVNLTSLYEDRTSAIGSYGITGHSYLSQVTLKNVTSIEAFAFANNTSLNTLKLSTSSTVTLQSSTAFISTKITPTTGSIYVPANTSSTYKTASNWSYFSNIIR